MAHWSDIAVAILTAKTTDLREFALIAGADPSTFYRGANLTGVDVSGQDLRHMDFAGSNLWAAKIDAKTLLDDEFRPLYSGKEVFKRAELSAPLYDYLDVVKVEADLRFKSNALRFLLEIVHKKVDSDEQYINYWKQEVHTDTRLRGHFNANRRRRRNMSFKITEGEHAFALKIGEFFHGTSAGYNAAVLIGSFILLRKAPSFNPDHMYQQLTFELIAASGRGLQ